MSDAEPSLADAYQHRKIAAENLLICLKEQVPFLLEHRKVSLGVPLEGRVKTFQSIKEKIHNKSGMTIDAIQDLVGLRIILLFKDDINLVHDLISENFDVVEFEDTSKRLDETQFGYASNHYIVRIKDEWRKIPSYVGLGNLVAEIQVRTVAQHIWAAASHKLQYKREEGVPIPLRGSINRASALLETVDLEFSRLLMERSEYSKLEQSKDEKLNVDSLAEFLNRTWPKENLSSGESYDDLLSDLQKININYINELEKNLKDRIIPVIKYDRKTADSYVDDPDERLVDEGRVGRGVYFTHVGLTRVALQHLIWPDLYDENSIFK